MSLVCPHCLQPAELDSILEFSKEDNKYTVLFPCGSTMDLWLSCEVPDRMFAPPCPTCASPMQEREMRGKFGETLWDCTRCSIVARQEKGKEVEFFENTAPKKKAAKKVQLEDPTRNDDLWEFWSNQAMDYAEKCDEVPEPGEDWAASVKEKLESIAGSIRDRQSVSSNQIRAIENMGAGVERWLENARG